MPMIRNISPLGALDVPLLGRVLEAGEEADVTEDQAERLLTQSDNYEAVDRKAKAVVKAIQEPVKDPEAGADTASPENAAGAPAEGAAE